jgi:Zn-dependent protease with chaperone function
MVPARYFDGRTGGARDVRLDAVDGRLRILGEDLQRDVMPSELQLSASRSAAPVRLVIRDGGQCEFPDTSQGRQLLEALRLRPGRVERLEAHGPAILASLLACVAAAAAIWFLGVPTASDWLVERLPRSVDARFGDSIIESLDEAGIVKPSALPDARRDAILHRFAGLLKPASAPAVDVAFRKLGMPNALAFPGGHILVSDELVELDRGDDDALMMVLGHELGHEAARDSMRAIVRSSLFSLLAAWYFGDISSAVAGAAAGFTNLHYSREAEHAADLFGLALMRSNSISTAGAVALFERLEGETPGRGSPSAPGHQRARLPSYLSTHPDMEERIELLKQGIAAAPH